MNPQFDDVRANAGDSRAVAAVPTVRWSTEHLAMFVRSTRALAELSADYVRRQGSSRWSLYRGRESPTCAARARAGRAPALSLKELRRFLRAVERCGAYREVPLNAEARGALDAWLTARGELARPPVSRVTSSMPHNAQRTRAPKSGMRWPAAGSVLCWLGRRDLGLG